MTEFNRQPIDVQNIIRKYGDVLHYQLLGSDAATAGNYTTIPFIAPFAIEVKQVSVSWTTASTSGTLQLERLQGTEAPGAGDSILAATVDLSATANTVVTRKGVDLSVDRQLAIGDRLALVDGGALTNLTDLQISIYYFPLGRGDYR